MRNAPREREIIEIHKTEYVDKGIPTIVYEHVKQEDMTRVERTFITVSDKTSSAALQTFKDMRKEIEKKKRALGSSVL